MPFGILLCVLLYGWLTCCKTDSFQSQTLGYVIGSPVGKNRNMVYRLLFSLVCSLSSVETKVLLVSRFSWSCGKKTANGFLGVTVDTILEFWLHRFDNECFGNYFVGVVLILMWWKDFKCICTWCLIRISSSLSKFLFTRIRANTFRSLWSI